MLGSKIRNVRNALGALSEMLTPEQRAIVSLTQNELSNIAESADDLEMALQYWFQRPTEGEKSHA